MRWPQISSSAAQRRVTTGTTEYFRSVSCGTQEKRDPFLWEGLTCLLARGRRILHFSATAGCPGWCSEDPQLPIAVTQRIPQRIPCMRPKRDSTARAGTALVRAAAGAHVRVERPKGAVWHCQRGCPARGSRRREQARLQRGDGEHHRVGSGSAGMRVVRPEGCAGLRLHLRPMLPQSGAGRGASAGPSPAPAAAAAGAARLQQVQLDCIWNVPVLALTRPHTLHGGPLAGAHAGERVRVAAQQAGRQRCWRAAWPCHECQHLVPIEYSRVQERRGWGAHAREGFRMAHELVQRPGEHCGAGLVARQQERLDLEAQLRLQRGIVCAARGLRPRRSLRRAQQRARRGSDPRGALLAAAAMHVPPPLATQTET